MRTVRPWGFFDVLFESPGFKVKFISVKPNQKLSLQSHKHRTESWTIVKGFGRVRIDNFDSLVFPGNTRIIYKNSKHRISASEEGVDFIEVQTGEILDEDDITRYEDDYGRAETVKA